MDRFQTIRRAVEDPRLSASEKVLATSLALRAKTMGREARKTWPKQAELAEAVGLSERQLRRATQSLVDVGFVHTWRMAYGLLYRIAASWNEVDAGASAGMVSVRTVNDWDGAA